MSKFVYHDFENCDCQCDFCNEVEMVDSADYSEINAELKSCGWVIRKCTDGEWHEFCCDDCFKNWEKKYNTKREYNPRKEI